MAEETQSDDNSLDEGEETIEERHRREKKEMLAEIQKIRKGVSKNDKKGKKESQEKISKMESELKEKHDREIKEEQNSKKDADKLCEGMGNLNSQDYGEPEESAEMVKLKKKMAKNQKRRDNKAKKNKERDEMIKQQELENLTGKRHLETQKLKQILASKNLRLFEIPSDGNCLYNAVCHQAQNLSDLKITNEMLRRQTANYMLEHKDDFMPFLTKPDTGDSYTVEEYEKYCEDIAQTSAWAGHLEIQAISHILNCKIEIVQAEGTPVVLGEDKSTFTLVLPYHRHAFGLGEHYNSVVVNTVGDEEIT